MILKPKWVTGCTHEEMPFLLLSANVVLDMQLSGCIQALCKALTTALCFSSDTWKAAVDTIDSVCAQPPS